MIATIDPSTGETLSTYEEHTDAEVERRLEQARRTFAEWRLTTFEQRGTLVRRLARLLRDRRDDCALLMAREMGKPVTQGRVEVDKCAWVCEHFAAHAEEYLAPEPVESDASRSYVTFEPRGPVLGIMPWSFPFWQVLRYAAPTVMAGNVALLKHAENVPGCALEIADCFRAAGFPDGVLQPLLVERRRVARLIADPAVAAISLTGSLEAGRSVARAAGQALKKTVLELGGSDPYVVLADADLEGAVSVCAHGRLSDSGQSCVAAKRFVVAEPLRRRFEELLVHRMESAVVGDPADPETEVGPLARVDLRDRLHAQVRASLARGARLLCGGRVPDRPGAWYPPTVLTGVSRGMPAHDEELVGPVAAVISARNEQEALHIANSSRYGLGAAVFTADPARGKEIVRRQLDAGCCFVNTFVRSDPRPTFGGVRDPGYGQELGQTGIRELVNFKNVHVA